MNYESLLYTMYATGYTFAMTAVGAATVLFLSGRPSSFFTKMSLGFAAGIMLAASMWSLLTPAINQAESMGMTPAIPVAGGFVLGAAFLLLLDVGLPHLHLHSKTPEGPRTDLPKHQLMFLAVTIHNIPEGMTVGIAFVAAMATGSPETLSAAIILAIGMGIQNVPEGIAVTMPLLTAGRSRHRAFTMGMISGIVEPIAACIVVIFASFFIPIMPWLLSFAAGAMIYVVVEELIPDISTGEHNNTGTISLIAGFVLMMVLDTAFG